MHIKQHLSFGALRKSIGEVFGQIDDRRQSGKVDFSLHDRNPLATNYSPPYQFCALSYHYQRLIVPFDHSVRIAAIGLQ
jgi:hypothetical protein